MLPDGNQLSSLRHILEQTVPLPNKLWTLAIPHLRSSYFPSGEHIIRAGEEATDLCFMISGMVRHYYLSSRGKEFNICFTASGQLISNFSSLVDTLPSPLYIQAIKPCECLSIPYRNFLSLSENYREWGMVRTKLLEDSLITKDQRVAELLVLSATERYKKFLLNHPEIAAALPNYQIASYLGITDVALSRIRRRMGLTASGTPLLTTTH